MTEIDRQIGADGGHLERSTHYHRYTLDFYLLALLTAERAGDQEATLAFSRAATRLADYMRAIADDRGWLQQIGDDDGGMLWPITGRDPRDVRDSLALAAAVLRRRELAPWGPAEEAFWVAMSSREPILTRGCRRAACRPGPAGRRAHRPARRAPATPSSAIRAAITWCSTSVRTAT